MSDCYDEFGNDAWSHSVHQYLLRALGTLPVIVRDKWLNVFVKAENPDREAFGLVDSAVVLVANIKKFMAECLHT